MFGQELAQDAFNGNLQWVKNLLAQGVSADSKGWDGYPALVNAGMKGHTAVAEALLTARANINATNRLCISEDIGIHSTPPPIGDWVAGWEWALGPEFV
eukprot:g63611.t1